MIDDEVCSLHLAKRLKELYAPQESEYCWVRGTYGFGVVRKWYKRRKNFTSAYTAEELFDLTPDYFIIGGSQYEFQIEDISPTEFKVYFSDGTYILDGHLITARTEADARAEMLIYLLENKYLNPEHLYGWELY